MRSPCWSESWAHGIPRQAHPDETGNRSISPRGRHESVAAADRRDLEIERRVPRVTAVIQQIFGRFALSANADQLAVGRVRLAKMATESALAFVNDLHDASIRFRVPREHQCA